MNDTVTIPAERHGSIVKRLAVAAGIVTACISLFGAVKSVVILPYRIEATEKAILELKPDHELLLRIDERLKNVQDKLDRETIRVKP